LRWGDAADREVAGITQDSRQAGPGMVFVALRGTASDGHRFLPAVAAVGAIALIVEDDSLVPADFKGAVVKVDSSRRALDQLAARFYGNPAADLYCVGVTGTNGKTTVTYMIEKIFNHFGWPTGVMGTIDHHLGARHWTSSLTTPDALTLQQRLKEFKELGARAAAFEVSSHALEQARVESLPFSVGIFTCFTRDHLDYHKTMEVYFAAKERFFRELLGRDGQPALAVLNADDPQVRRTQVREGVSTWTYGRGDADFKFNILKQDLNGSLFHLTTPRGPCEILLPFPGVHNVYNAVSALAAALFAGVSLQTAADALAGFYGAPGRLQKVPNTRGLHIFVDYAHTDDALRTVLRAVDDLRSGPKKGRIISVFGCGGDRDTGKRPLMARAASEHADVMIVTSDNPRSEDPGAIIAQVVAGIPKDWVGERHVEADRRRALALALQIATDGDVILITGKGHEDYQIIGREKLPFSDVLAMTELLKDSP
jgi:UDP-N-acetylmuramoyl-L-alanyl-D-glutamate--2,6-diaminopimelate ligase